MKKAYDKYYQTENLFGKAYPELIDFFSKYPIKGKLLDLGCGQGRDAIPLARLGYEVTGIDNSKIGIEQMTKVAQTENLQLKGIVDDIYEYADFNKFDFILLDSMFHFMKNDLLKETDFIQRIINSCKSGAVIVFCIQNTGKKLEILKETISFQKEIRQLIENNLQYEYKDHLTGHISKTDYKMLVIQV